jgi:hypothetical protein
MWDDDINKKIKDAADQYHPAYNDTAWNKMEQLLDEHLPQKKDRRRIFYLFLPLVLLVAGVAFFAISRKTTSTSAASEITSIKDNSRASTSQQTPVDYKGVSDEPAKSSGKTLLAGNDPVSKKGIQGTLLSQSANTDKGTPTKPYSIKKDQFSPGKGSPTASNNSSVYASSVAITPVENNVAEPASGEQPKTAGEKQSSALTDNVSASANVDANVNHDATALTDASKNNSSTVQAEKKEDEKAKDPKTPKATSSKPASTHKFSRGFAIGVSAGPDVSGVRINNTGKITIAYGGRLQYTINRFTIASGFYVARKIYSVAEDDYHIQPGSGANTAYLQSVSANCMVYEIPLTLSYNFGQLKNHGWFVSAGLSSYLMKNESYVYLYKYPWRNSEKKYWSVSNANKHYFSVLDFSGGYQYVFNRKFSLDAEPYLKLPLSGIGAGKIKLNSAGLLFTLSLKPFVK